MNKITNTNKYVFLAGGLTGGPIMPLLAVMKVWQDHDQFATPVIFDVKNSASKSIAHNKNIIFHRLITGKLRRYFSWVNFIAPILFMIGCLQSIYYISRYKPVAILGAGGFAQVPLMLMGWLLRVPNFIHQQDVAPTLSNQLISPFAKLVTTTFESSLKDFLQGTGLGKKYISTDKVFWTGNPVMHPPHQIAKNEAKKRFGLSGDLPVLLVIGGASGAKSLNEKIVEALPELIRVVEVIHSTGVEKYAHKQYKGYATFEFIDDMPSAYAASDIVLARAGIGTLTELASYEKPGIIIPMPDTHQEDNATLIHQSEAGLAIDQNDLSPQLLIKAIRKILFDIELQNTFTQNLHRLFPPDAETKVYKLITKSLEQNARAE